MSECLHGHKLWIWVGISTQDPDRLSRPSAMRGREKTSLGIGFLWRVRATGESGVHVPFFYSHTFTGQGKNNDFGSYTQGIMGERI